MEEGEAIESNMVTKAIENAQRKVEAHNFDIRKHLLEYDDVANDQRKVIYEWRNELLGGDDVFRRYPDDAGRCRNRYFCKSHSPGQPGRNVEHRRPVRMRWPMS